MRKNKPAFDKYKLYQLAVQSPDSDVEFLFDTYKKLRRKRPFILREDFCGTFAISCAWVELDKENVAYGVDLDLEPIKYGREHFFENLNVDEQNRLFILQQNVLVSTVPPVDVIAAMNFSYYLFKTRESLRIYFKKCLEGLKPGGILVVDSFGGPLCQEANEEKRRVGDFVYYWNQESFDPLTNEAIFHIHFKRRGERKRKNLFNYDWRLWTLPEIRETMREAGFQRTHIYWEGTTRKGEGNGIFKPVEKGEECEAWVAYVVGEK